MNKNRLLRLVLFSAALVASLSLSPARALAATPPACTDAVLRSPNLFNCIIGPGGVPQPQAGPASTYFNPVARAAYPAAWDQYGFNQPHDPVFPGNPAYTGGTFWASPLTGSDMLHAFEAQPTFDHPEDRATRTGQTLGQVMGVSVANGIVYSQLGRREVNALDATTGKRIWRTELVNVAGMGQTIVHNVSGKPMVFVPVGDEAFNVYNAVAFSNGEQHDRGASFGALYALDGLTGALKWRFDVKGAARPAPIFRDGKIYLATGGGELFVLNAATGAQIGVATNPGGGFPGLASPNWVETASGQRYIIYGISRPRMIIAMNVSNPAAPNLAWQRVLPNAASNAPGDTPVAVDPALGLIVTTVFSSIAGENHLIAYGINATTGAITWSQDLGTGDSPPGFKGSVPMIKNGNVYVGNTINRTLWSLVAATGAVRWSTDVSFPGEVGTRPRAAPAFFVTASGNEVLIHPAGRHIRTIDAETGAILNTYSTLGLFSVFGTSQPAIVGNQMYLATISGWVYAAPVDFIMTNPGVPTPPSGNPEAPPVIAETHPEAAPSQGSISSSPASFPYYAGGQTNNALVNAGGPARSWRTALRDALPLMAPPLDQAIYGAEIATQLTHWEFGVGSGVSVARGMVYASSSRYHISALNAATGKLVWRFKTLNRNFGQPIVTPNTVIVGGGDPYMPLSVSSDYAEQSPSTVIGAHLQHMTGLDPKTGLEKWTVWTGSGTSTQTPLYHNGNVYWMTGDGDVYAVTADSGAPVAPFMTVAGRPRIRLPGFNVISSPKLYIDRARALMVVGLAMPSRLIAIDLATAQTVWTQDLASYDIFLNGFSATTVAVDQEQGVIVGSVLANVDLDARTADLLAFGLDAKTGAVRWTRTLGSGAYREGFVAAVPVLSRGAAFFTNPVSSEVVSLNAATGAIRWQTAVVFPAGRYSWGPGVVTGENAKVLIEPIGPDLYSFDTDNGVILDKKRVGGSFTYNNPVVAGKTLYIGNSWGWVIALPVKSVTGKKEHDEKEHDEKEDGISIDEGAGFFCRRGLNQGSANSASCKATLAISLVFAQMKHVLHCRSY